MKLDLTIEKNVVLKRDKPWSQFYSLTDQDLLCYNEQKKFESVNSSNGKIEHLSNKTATTRSKASLAHCLSNNGQLCAFLSPTYEVTIWDKDKSIRTTPSCVLAMKAIKSKPCLYVSNNGDQVILVLKQPCRVFLWLKSFYIRPGPIRHHHKSPICSSIAHRSTDDSGTWHELTLTHEHSQALNDIQHDVSIDVFFRSKHCSAVCALVFVHPSGYVQLHRLDIDWKPTIHTEQPILYTFEIHRVPLIFPCQSCSIRFAHASPIAAISLSTHLLFVSLTTITFSKLIPVSCSFNTSPTQQQVSISDFLWNYNDQFVIGLTNRGAMFFLHRFGSQLNLMTAGECIAQGPSLFVIIHPLIGQDSEATTHLGLDSFMRSIVPFARDDKTKQQKFSLAVHPTKPLIYCSDGYRLARLVYSDKIRDRRLYDPLLYLHIMDLNEQQQHPHFVHKTRSFDDLPKVTDRLDNESIGGGVAGPGDLTTLSKYGSLTSLAMEESAELSMDELFSAYQLHLTSPDRIQHDRCACLERTTKSLLLSPDHQDLLAPIQLSQRLTDLVLSSSFGSMNFLHLSCLTKFVPLFMDIFQQQTTVVNDPEVFHLSLLYIIEQWLQAVLQMPTRLNTFELCRRQQIVQYQGGEEDNQIHHRLCKAIRQLELLQGTKINLDEFLASAMPSRRQNAQDRHSHYNRLTLLRSWYKLWSSVERKLHHETKNPPKYLITIRLFLQSLLSAYPSLKAIRLSPNGRQTDLNDVFPPTIAAVDHPLHTKGYTTLNERRKQRRRSRSSITDQVPSSSSSRQQRRRKAPTEARKALVLHRVLYALLEQYQIRDAVCILNVALRRETSLHSSYLPLDLFSSNLFQQIDTRTHFGLPGHALRSVLRTLARFMARAMITSDGQDHQQQPLFVYSVDSANPLPNLFKPKLKANEEYKSRMIYLDRNRLNLAVEQQKISKFWQPLKVLELFILGQSPNEAVLFAKLVGDWRTAVCLASVLPPEKSLSTRSASTYSPLDTVTVDALLYTKLCEYLQIDNLKTLLKRAHKQDEIISFLQHLSSTLEQFLLCSTLLQVPLAEMLFKRLNAIMIYLFTLMPIFISSKYYLPCPPIYASILNTYDDEKSDVTCKYETHLRLIFYRTIHIFIQCLSACRIQTSCMKWYLDYLTAPSTKRKQPLDERNDSFYSLRILLKSLRFHKLPNIPDRILIYFRDFCTILFLLDIRDRLSLLLRQHIREKTELTQTSDQKAWEIISYATILLSFRCLISDEIVLLRTVLNLFFDLTPSEQLMRALATLVIARQHADSDRRTDAELALIISRLQARWAQMNPTYIQLYDGFLQTIIVQDVQTDIVGHYMNDKPDHRQEVLFDFKPKWFETSVEYGKFMTILVPLLLDTSSLTNANQKEVSPQDARFDSTSIPLLQTMSSQLRELQLPISLDKRYLLKQAPLFVPPHEYVVFPVRMAQYDNQQTMFQQTPTSVNQNAVGSFVNSSTGQQPPDVVSLEHHHQRSHPLSTSSPNPPSNHPSVEWDGRSDDPSRSHIRQFDPPYADGARQAIWMSDWANRNFTTTTNDRVQPHGMRIPTSAQFLAAASLVSDPQRYETALKQHHHHHQHKPYHDQADNDTDLTNVTKDSEDDDVNGLQSDFASSPRRRDVSFRKNSLEESMSLPIMSNDGDGELIRSHDFRAPSRETGGDETPTYDPREFPTHYYKEPIRSDRTYPPRASPAPQMSPPTSNGFQQLPTLVRSSTSNRRFLDDSDPFIDARLEQEERDKYAAPVSIRTTTSNHSISGYQPPSQRSQHRQDSSPDAYDRQSPSRQSRGRHSPSRRSKSQRSPRRDRHRPAEAPYFPQLPQAPSFYEHGQPAVPIPYAPSIRLPLLRLGASIINTAPILTQSRPQASVYPPAPVYVPAPVQICPPLQMLQFAPQLPPPVALSPRATRADQQKSAYVQNIMQHYAEQNRPRLQLLQLRYHPQPAPVANPTVPMPAHNVVTTSTDSKVDAGVQAEVPRQDGFLLEPGLFQTLLRDATGVNFTSAEAHYSAARQIQQQALDARRRECSTMTDLPAHQILYDLQYGRGGDGDERKFVNVTDIAGPHADALLSQIERDQMEREQLRMRQQPQQIPPPVPMITSINDLPPGTNQLGFNRQHEQILREQQPIPQPFYPQGFGQQAPIGFGQQAPIDFDDANERQRQSELILQRRRQREEEEKQAEQIAFGTTDGDRSSRRVSYEPQVQTYEFDEDDVSLEHLIRQPRSQQPTSDRSSRLVDPISARSTTPRSPRKKPVQEPPISIKITTPRDPFSPRKTHSQASHSTAGTPRKTHSPTIAERHREARQRQQQMLSRVREENALRFADAALHGEPIPPTRALNEFQLEALETSFTSTVRELAGPDGLINRTYDLDLMDDNDDIEHLYSDRLPARPMSATSFNANRSASQRSNSSSSLPRPSSASSSQRRSRPMTPMGKAIVQVKQKGPPPARSNMARKRPMSSPGNFGQKRGSMTAPAKSNQNRTRMVPTMRKTSPPAHKATTYNQRVRSLNKSDNDTSKSSKADPTDPKALMRLYGTRRVPGLYVPYEKTDPRVTKTYSERMKELQQTGLVPTQRPKPSQDYPEQDFERRPSSAPSSSVSLSDWEVDDRIKQLLADEQDLTLNKRRVPAVAPLGNLDELDDDEEMNETTYSLTRVTQQTNENTYGDDLRSLQFRRPSAPNTNAYGGTRASARSSAGGDTARDESELSRAESSLGSYIDWSLIDKDYGTATQ